MIKCDNCGTPAAFKTDDPSTRPQHFCKAHLPWHLKKRADLGLLVDPNFGATNDPEPAAEPVVEEAPKPAKKKKAAPAPAPVEEPVVEEAVEEAPVAPVEEPEDAQE